MMKYKYNGINYQVDTDHPIDISLPVTENSDNVSAWYVPPAKIVPVKENGFIGDVNQGGSVNFKNITFNPHGNGTHTECVGHISKEKVFINSCLKKFFYMATLISVTPVPSGSDKVITGKSIQEAFNTKLKPQALIIRTLPNGEFKKTKNYSGSNPPYLNEEAIAFIVEHNIQHLLVDLPSIDKENDGGKLTAHHKFWNYPNDIDESKTITELIYVPNHVKDGDFLLNLMIPSFEMDAAPSKPILYPVKKVQ